MAEQTLSFDARDVVVSWGEIELQGAAPGTFVTVVYDDAQVKKTRGAQNFVIAVVTGNDGAKLTWTASQASPVNDRLSQIALLQLQPGVGLIKKPIFLKHINGTTLAVGPEAWIEKIPDSPFAEDHQNREWAFDVAHMRLFVGGSTR